LLSGIALALCVLADVRMAIYAVALLVLYVLIVQAKGTRRTWINALGLLLVVAIVALALSAAAWLPALTLTDGSARSNLSTQEAGALSLDAAYVLGTLIADRSGAAERTTYFGLVVLILAFVGLKLQWQTRRRLMIWFVVVMIFGMLAALGTNTPFYELLYRLPGLTLFRVPARAWFSFFAMAALAGFGVQFDRVEWPAQAPIDPAGDGGLSLCDPVRRNRRTDDEIGQSVDAGDIRAAGRTADHTASTESPRTQSVCGGDRGVVDQRSIDARLGALSSDRFG
jgi:hypothetical protein